MDFWQRLSGISKRERKLNDKVREIMGMGMTWSGMDMCAGDNRRSVAQADFRLDFSRDSADVL